MISQLLNEEDLEQHQLHRPRNISVSCELKRLWKCLQKEREAIFGLLGQEELLSRFVPSLFGDQKIIEEAYNLFLLMSYEKEELKREIHDDLEFHLFQISSIKNQFYSLNIEKCDVHSSSSNECLHQLHGYFELESMEEVEEIPDELPSE